MQVPDERVRACLSCSAIISFQEDPCPHCGAPQEGDQGESRVKVCLRCSAMLPFSQVFCAACGELGGALPDSPVVPAAPPSPDRWAVPLVAAGLAGIVVGLGCLGGALVCLL